MANPLCTKYRILAIEDDRTTRALLGLVYGRQYELHDAASLAEARARLAAEQFDLILLGGDSAGAPELEALRPGVVARLPKPVDLHLLSETISTALVQRGRPVAGDAPLVER